MADTQEPPAPAAQGAGESRVHLDIAEARQAFYAAFDEVCTLELDRGAERKLAEIFESSILNAILKHRLSWSTDIVRRNFALERVKDIARKAMEGANAGEGLTTEPLDRAAREVVDAFRELCPDLLARQRRGRAPVDNPGTEEGEFVFCEGFR